MSKRAFFWFRRDLRLHDNAGLYHALRNNTSVRCIFIFDIDILNPLLKELGGEHPVDLRVLFIHRALTDLQQKLRDLGGELEVYHGRPKEIWARLLKEDSASDLYLNHDYEPYAIRRDRDIEELCHNQKAHFFSFKDQVIFEKNEVLSGKETPYTVFTPYKKKWLSLLSPYYLKSYPVQKYLSSVAKVGNKFGPKRRKIPTLQSLGFASAKLEFPLKSVPKPLLLRYSEDRDFPTREGTSRIGVHLRFGTVSIREVVSTAKVSSQTWLSELIWREFFMQILFHFPKVEHSSFRSVYDSIAWRRSKADLKRWQDGQTGFPLVDAGMRELNQTGYMHNRVRMVAASFLTKHLLIHWREGERYFAKKLLDYELSSNNGNWQWAAGSGCDAAPYFRVFNPQAQLERFDKNEEYVKKWVPEYASASYAAPMVNHVSARIRALNAYDAVLKSRTL